MGPVTSPDRGVATGETENVSQIVLQEEGQDIDGCPRDDAGFERSLARRNDCRRKESDNDIASDIIDVPESSKILTSSNADATLEHTDPDGSKELLMMSSEIQPLISGEGSSADTVLSSADNEIATMTKPHSKRRSIKQEGEKKKRAAKAQEEATRMAAEQEAVKRTRPMSPLIPKGKVSTKVTKTGSLDDSGSRSPVISPKATVLEGSEGEPVVDPGSISAVISKSDRTKPNEGKTLPIQMATLAILEDANTGKKEDNDPVDLKKDTEDTRSGRTSAKGKKPKKKTKKSLKGKEAVGIGEGEMEEPETENSGTRISGATGLARPENSPAGSKATQVSNISDTSTIVPELAKGPDSGLMLSSKPRFGFDDYRKELICKRHDCMQMTNCYDASTVLCPRCGSTSSTRYCSLRCLLDPDMRFHWREECGRVPLDIKWQLDYKTIQARQVNIRPFVTPKGYIPDSAARHRQAVFHSSNERGGDYFVFDDFCRISRTVPWTAATGTGQVIAVAELTENLPLDPQATDADRQLFALMEGYSAKDLFQNDLIECLGYGNMLPNRCLSLATMVIEDLKTKGMWNNEVSLCLAFQFKCEFGYDIPGYLQRLYGA